MTGMQKGILIGCGACVLLGFALLAAGFLFFLLIDRAFQERLDNFDAQQQPWVECAIPHSDAAPVVTFLQRNSHPFLAEYEYKVRFGDGQEAVERWLPNNCGGRTRINVYWYPANEDDGPRLRLQDHWGEYLIDLNEKKTYLIVKYKGRVFAGEVSESNPVYTCSESENSGLHASVGDNEAIDITDTQLAAQSGRYLGRIDGESFPVRFVPASAASETPIEMVESLSEK